MNRRKGMSQVLALIVAASVLMMTALTVIFMVTGSSQDTQRQVDVSSCQGTVQAICAGSNAQKPLPATCQGPDGTATQTVATAVVGVNQGENQVDCGAR